MRISTNQIYATGIQGMMRNQARLDKLQNQIASDTKILTAADDPVGAAQVLAVSQSLAVEQQYQTNQSGAKSQLSLVDVQLNSLTTALQAVRDNIVKGGNATYTPADRESVAKDLESSLAEILGIANTDNGIGDYLFSGYQGGTRPFAADGLAAKAPATESSIAYSGDAGERLVQVSPSRQMAINVSGAEVFMNGKNGNGTFVAATGGNDVGLVASSSNTGSVTQTGWSLDRAQWDAALANTVPPVAALPLSVRFIDASNYEVIDSAGNTTGSTPYTAGAAINLSVNGVNYGAQITLTGTPVAGDSFAIQPGINQGTGVIDMGSVTDTQKWSAAVNNTTNAGTPVEIRFSTNATTGKLEYSIYDPVGGSTTAQAFTTGQTIPLVTKNGVDFGSQVVVTGTPKVGDTFTVTPSTSQSVFQTIQNVIGILRSPVGSSTYSTTQLTNDLAGQLSNLDLAMSQISDVLATVGANERELDALASTSSDLVIQYQATISDIAGLDYNKTYSDYTRQMVNLEAAQKSFVKIAGLSLFQYI
jgi:flagellar hook-associated protein 3 FlgL